MHRACARWLLALLAPPLAAQCNQEITEADGYVVRNVRVEARWGSLPDVQLPVAGGDRYSPARVSEALSRVAAAVREQQRFDAAMGMAAVLFATSCTRVVGPKQVDVIFEPVYLRVPLGDLGGAMLPLPRSNRPSAVRKAPLPSRIPDPRVGLEYDKAAGAALRAEAGARAGGLDFNFRGGRSLDTAHYDGAGGLAWRRRNFRVGSEFSAARAPRHADDFLRNAVRSGVSVKLGRVVLGAHHRWSADRLGTEARRENAAGVHAVADRMLWGGFARAALWGESAGYRRGALAVGYEKEIPLALNRTIGVEALAGAGRAWGDPPAYALFYAGNQGASFLYERPEALGEMPAGPLLRSFGVGGAAGARSYWQASLNVSVPVPKWSVPLVPNEPLGGDEELGTLKSAITNFGVNSAENVLAAHYRMRGGMTEAEAARQAARDIASIRGPVTYLANYANIFAVKPLIMMDAARAGPGTRCAAGGGIQVIVVTARFEAGYVRTLNRAAGESRGNLVLRLVFQNIF
ncbi:MAG: hypothetical protein ACE15B_01960 [Bryobacteraceae bacterium]